LLKSIPSSDGITKRSGKQEFCGFAAEQLWFVGHIMKSTPCRKISFVARALLTGTFSQEMTGLKDRRGPSSAQLCHTIILCIISFEFFTDECKVFLDSYLA